jgi:hypothetical protein
MRLEGFDELEKSNDLIGIRTRHSGLQLSTPYKNINIIIQRVVNLAVVFYGCEITKQKGKRQQ